MSEPLTEDEEQCELDELMAEMAKNERDPEQCNKETGRYNREFLYNVRDLEKLCSITECPLEPHQLKEFGLCPSIPNTKFAPLTWHMKLAGRIERRQATVAKIEQDLEQCNEETGWYSRKFLCNLRKLQKLYAAGKYCPLSDKLKEYGIWSSGQRRGKYDPNKQPTVRPFKSRMVPDELLKPLHKAEHPFKLEKINDDSDDARKELLIRQVRALLNKITTATERELTLEFIDYKVYQSHALTEIVSIIVSFALEETFCELFTRLCHYQITDERANSGDNHSTFHDAILYSLQMAMDFSNEKEPEADANAYIDSKRQLRRRWFGSVKFIDQLYLQGLISMRMDFVDDLLRSVIVNSEIAPEKPDEASIEGALILVGTIGHRLQYANEAATVAERKPFPLDGLFSALQKVKPFVGSRIRFLIEDVVGQRANEWKPMTTVREDARNAAAERDKERLLKLRQNPSLKQSATANQEKKLERSEGHQKNRERDLALVAAKTNSKIKYARISKMPEELLKSSSFAWYTKQVGLIEILQAKVAKMEQDLEQCNVKTGWYNRNYLYIFRDFQKLFPTSKDCPVKAVIKECGIWSSSKGRSKYDSNKHTKPTVIPTDSSQIPDELLKPLHKAENPWKLKKINDDSYDAKKELLIRQVRSLLNKITPTTEKSLTKEFLEYKVYQSPALREIVSIIVNFALEEFLCELFTRLCHSQVTDERANSGDNHSTFHDDILNSLQMAMDFSNEKETETEANAYIDSKRQLRRRWFGSVKFIDQLYLQGLISMRMDFVDDLLRSVIVNSETTPEKPDEASIEGALILVGTIGHRLQYANEIATVAERKPFPLDRLFNALQKVKPCVGSRIRFMIEDVVDQRANKWKPMNTVREDARKTAAEKDTQRLLKLRQNPKQYTISKEQKRLASSEWHQKKRERELALKAANTMRISNKQSTKIHYPKSTMMPEEPLKSLHKADHPWRLEKLNDDSDDARKELLIRQARAILNKITPTTEDTLTDQFLEYKVYESSAIKEIVSIIVDMAQSAPKYCELLSRFALAQCNIERNDAKSSAFHEALVVHVEEAFQLGSWAYGRIFEKKSETDEKKQADSLESLNKLRSRRFGMSLFIGQLHAFGLIKHVFASSCVLSLLSSLTENANGKPDEASIECALGLLRLSGHRLQEFEQRASSKAKPFSIKLTFTALRGAKSLVINRIRFLIMDLEEQRANGWIARVSTRNGPESIDETKKERKTKKGNKKEDESDKNEEKVEQKKGRHEKSEKQKKSIMAANKSLNWRRN